MSFYCNCCNIGQKEFNLLLSTSGKNWCISMRDCLDVGAVVYASVFCQKKTQTKQKLQDWLHIYVTSRDLGCC